MGDNVEKEAADGVETSRRRFLKTAGKIAVYTPPAMLLMSKPSFATFNKTGGEHNYVPYRRYFSFRTFSFRRFWRRHGR
jgi:hypothetical protein